MIETKSYAPADVKENKEKQVETKEASSEKPVKKEEKKKDKKNKGIESTIESIREFLGTLTSKIVITGVIIALVISILALILILNKNIILALMTFVVIFILYFVFLYFNEALKKSERINKMQDVFPDFLQLMSSNLRAGMTIDRAMTLSAREELAPLDKEILRAGREIATGKNIENALLDMSNRIDSEKISRVILLIISGIKSGGNVATILEETAANMRERNFVEKRAASNVLMYVIFIFIAVSIGAPILFSLSSILVEVLQNILSTIPVMPEELVSKSTLPFTFSKIDISLQFIQIFCIIFILVSDLLASLTLGLVNKGDEKEGLKYLFPLILISLTVFFLVRFLLRGVVTSFF
jgi:archaeal flagellar protein FlaJ